MVLSCLSSRLKMLLLLFLTFSASVAKPKKLLYTVANPARGLLTRDKNKIKSGLQRHNNNIPVYIYETAKKVCDIPRIGGGRGLRGGPGKRVDRVFPG